MTQTPATEPATTEPATTKVEFWFDPACPWAWMTSRWIDEVARQREGLDVTWHVMSLALLNGYDDPESPKRARYAPLHLVTAVGAGIGAELGNDALKRFYDEMGRRNHNEGREGEDGLLAEALEAAQVPDGLLERAEAGEFDEVLRESHERGMALVGEDVGTPIISVNGVAFFGPVISPAPKGETALQLFDGIVAAAGYDGFFELKRSRTREPEFDA